jgi:hypothetical protein
MKPGLIAAAALFALAACDKPDGPKGGDMSAEDVAEELSEMRIEPGQWEATNEIVSASAPGIPADALAGMVGRKTTESHCITPEQAERPDANFRAAQENSDCTYQDWSMEDGRMSGTMTCKGKDLPGTMVMKMDGTYGEEDYAMTMTMETRDLPGGMTMAIKARTTGHRTGECAS